MSCRCYYLSLLFASSMVLSSCGSAPTVPASEEDSAEGDTDQSSRPERIPDKAFSADTLYALLVAELALGRQRHDIALNNYVQQATATKDAGVAEHATHLARMLRSEETALAMAELWTEAEPENPEARNIYASGLVQARRFDEAFEQARLLIQAGESAAFEDLAANAATVDPDVRLALTRNYQQLLQNHPDNVSLLVGYSFLLEQQNNYEGALTVVRKAQKYESQSVTALYQEARLLQLTGRNDEAMRKMGKLVEANPENHRLRLRYAKSLIKSNLPLAHKQFQLLSTQLPFDQDVVFSLALIERELQIFDSSIKHFKDLIGQGQHVSASHYQLGKIYETQRRPDLALPHYLEVGEGNNYPAALTHATRILVDQEKRSDALDLVRLRRSAQQAKNRSRLYMLEADLLSQSGNNGAAEKVLSEGLELNPNEPSLLYARALLYANIDFVEAAEKDLLAVLVQKPDDAAALNALGYTLADKTDRLEEALEYISRALALTPDDPAVLDSMGWVQYRKGNFEEALIKLRKAMKALPDPEIAAHLGEVLWVSGKTEEAREVWRSGLKLKPQSKIIHQTIHRLNATLD